MRYQYTINFRLNFHTYHIDIVINTFIKDVCYSIIYWGHLWQVVNSPDHCMFNTIPDFIGRFRDFPLTLFFVHKLYKHVWIIKFCMDVVVVFFDIYRPYFSIPYSSIRRKYKKVIQGYIRLTKNRVSFHILGCRKVHRHSGGGGSDHVPLLSRPC